MSRNLESVIVRASVSALEYREAAWEAHDAHVSPPDPSVLSDPALDVILRYEASDVPSEALSTLRVERKRRTRRERLAELPTIGMLLMLALSGLVIGWYLLVR